MRQEISAHTVSLIDERHAARVSRNHRLEQSLHKQVKKSAKQWLGELAPSGAWNSLKQLRKRKQPSQGRLRDSSGECVSSEMRADTFAKHLEQVQWAVRPCSADVPSEEIGPDLPVDCAPMTLPELEAQLLLKKLAQGKAAGIDGIPAELWKATLADQETFISVLGFCNACWYQRSTPDHWHASMVGILFKKGDVSECENYRPISLQREFTKFPHSCFWPA